MLQSLLAEIGPIPWPHALAMAVTMLVAGFVMGFLGFGASIIIVVVASQILGPVAAIPIATLISLPAMAQLLPNAVKHAERRFVIPYGLATFATAPLGVWVLVSVEPALIKIAISVLVLAMVAMLYRGWKPARPLGTVGIVGVGLAASVIQGAAGVGGPPAVAVALSRTGEATVVRANVICALTALSMSSMIPLVWFGLLTPRILIICAVLFPLYPAAIWVGARYFSRGGHGYYRTAALAALAAMGIVTGVLSARDYLGA
jgi:uncharacterized membrane protein YfcA